MAIPAQRGLLAAAAILAAGSVLAGLAGHSQAGSGAASGALVKTTITLKLGDGTKAPPAHGRVISAKPPCVKGRSVKLVVVAPGSGIIDFADNKTNAKGKWVFSSQLQGATSVRAEVKARKAGGVSCGAAVSPTKTF